MSNYAEHAAMWTYKMKLWWALLRAKRQMKLLARSLVAEPAMWIRHDADMPGLVHIVHVSRKFSLYSYGSGEALGEVGLLSEEGDVYAAMPWADRFLLSQAMNAALPKLSVIAKPVPQPDEGEAAEAA